MSAVPAKALKDFYWARNGVNVDVYQAGTVYTFPPHIATSFAKQGRVEILKPSPEKKAKAKPKAEPKPKPKTEET